MAEEKKKAKVLVAEDTESNFLLVSYILRNQYEILWAHDGVETLELYQRENPDIILMDIRMPRLGGLATTAQIRSQDTKIPIIAVTAFAFDSDRERTLEAGCTDFLAKPINATALREIVEKYVDKH
ncbi:MAG: response regulator [Bacteroidales bacterium]|jgi:CheY-like chemotaxis protein|nr:response regulator [Bacteroidales bacterium]